MRTRQKAEIAQPDTLADVAAESTPYLRLVEHVLGRDLCSYVAERDAEGVSRRAIARELSDKLSATVGKRIDISDMSISRWCGPR